jgi:TrmH family RNA methyltransferase
MLTKSRIKYIQRLGQKKFRDAEGLFVAEGPKIVNELLKLRGYDLHSLYALPEWAVGREGKGQSGDDRKLNQVSETLLKEISFLSTPNQVLGIFRKPKYPPAETRGKISLALDHIQDPGNLGTIIRIADWFAVSSVFCSPECADAFGPKVVQATMGSICRVRIEYINLVNFLAGQSAIPVYGAMVEGPPFGTRGKIAEGILVIGNESRGISPALLPFIRYSISIPRKGGAESLNAAVATGILLSHLA